IHTTYNLSDCMFFYQFMGDKIILCYLTEDVCSQLEQPVDQGYSFKELWSLGFGRLSYLLEEKLVYDKE
ncbi:MAG: hypothetical protein SVY10_15190, partial [Thermodesulfobacteriota bacterium]|nr:hypothetical protein [Thermodesulfobacteriota bacterium]